MEGSEWQFLGMAESEKFNYLLMLTIATVLFGILLPWLWSRRKLYTLSMQLAGPVAFPFVGSIACIIRIVSSVDPMKTIYKIMQQYPGLIRLWLGPELVIPIHKPEDVESIMKCRVMSAKPPRLFNMWVSSLGNGLVTSPGLDGLWKTHRRIISPAFCSATLISYQPILQRHSEQLLEDLGQFLGMGVTDYAIVITRYLGDYTTESLFNYKTVFREGKEDVVMHSLEWISAAIYKRMMHFWNILDIVYRFTQESKNQVIASGAIRGLCSRIFDEKMKTFDNIKGKKNPSTVEVLLEAGRQGTMSRNEAIEEMMNIWGAAVDTMNVDVQQAILMMAIHKECQDKAFQEIRQYYREDRDAPVEKDHLQNFPYLDMCLKEVLRLFPAGTANIRYATDEFVMKNRNVVIPPMTTVALLMGVSNMDPEVWPEPEVFIPERFSPEEVARRHPYAFYPFSGGLRNCLGQKYGYDTVKTAMVYILRRFELHSDWKLKDIPRVYDINVRSGWGYKAQFMERKW